MEGKDQTTLPSLIIFGNSQTDPKFTYGAKTGHSIFEELAVVDFELEVAKYFSANEAFESPLEG